MATIVVMPPRTLSALAVLAVAAAVVAAPPPVPATATSTAGTATLAAENFDGLTPQLRPRVDETGVPADVLGFTPTAPPGWT